MNLDLITPLILTFNEEANIERTLAALDWAKDIIVVDSGSTDRTEEMLQRNSRVRVFRRDFDSHARQWEFALRETEVRTPWVLALDADYVLTTELIAELGTLSPAAHVAGYRTQFTYVVDGRPLRGSLYPPSVTLYRPERALYVQDGHAQQLQLDGEIADLNGRILHDDRKPFARWRAAQRRYMRLEAAKLTGSRFAALSWPDRLRKLVVVAPPLVLAYCLLVKGCIWQGRAGWKYAGQRTLAELMLSAALLRREGAPD
jgi:glycosyltransferase involved in cell wall biosynthesis